MPTGMAQRLPIRDDVKESARMRMPTGKPIAAERACATFQVQRRQRGYLEVG